MLTGKMFIIGKLILLFRKLRPPPLRLRNRALQHFSRPKMFTDDQDFVQISNPECHFDGWSFINNEDK